MRADQTQLRQGKCELDDGRRVRYLLHKRQRDPVYLVRFIGPDGKKKELTTKERDLARAHAGAARTILLEFRNYVAEQSIEPRPVSKRPLGWDDAQTLLVLNMRMSGLQGSTIESYKITIRLLRKEFPETGGPAEISSEMAQLFRERRLAAGASKGTVASNLMTLSTIYTRWWQEVCGMLTSDPFAKVKVVVGEQL